MAKNWKSPKDPDEVVDYGINWAEDEAGNPGRAADDPIASSTWTVPTGIVKNSDTFDDGSTTIWLSGGTAGQKYRLTNRIVTTGGRTYDQTVVLKVADR
jgi:hypothetical protein